MPYKRKEWELTIRWRVDGKVKEITKIPTTGGVRIITFDYDAMGHRIAKHSKLGGIPESSSYYILDASGNTMSVYEEKVVSSASTFNQTERYIYGSSRVGVYDEPTLLKKNRNTRPLSNCCGSEWY